jgi:hypothetical protein
LISVKIRQKVLGIIPLLSEPGPVSQLGSGQNDAARSLPSLPQGKNTPHLIEQQTSDKSARQIDPQRKDQKRSVISAIA